MKVNLEGRLWKILYYMEVILGGVIEGVNIVKWVN